MALDMLLLPLYDAATNTQHYDARLGRTVEKEHTELRGKQW
jgi:hypothetical protein